MESKGMALRSRRAPQFAEIFRYQATAQDIQVKHQNKTIQFLRVKVSRMGGQDDLEKMYRSLQRLKRRRLSRAANIEQAPASLGGGRDNDKAPLFKKERGRIDNEEEGTDEVQSKLTRPDFQHWAKFDPLHYNRTFQ